MEQRQGYIAGLIKRIILRQFVRGPRLQQLWSRLHTLAIFGMNYGGGGNIDSSGEEWVLSEVVARACAGVATPVVFDIGANVGDYALLVRRHIPSALIYAFEPSALVYRQLTENLSARGGTKARPYNIGFSDMEKDVELYSYSIEGQEISLLSSLDRRLPTQVREVQVSSTQRIQTQTIDSFCFANEIGRIDFLKLDVEGHELPILRGASRSLASRAISMIQFEFGPANIYSRTYFYDFWSLLSEAYDLYRIIPKGIVPISYYGEHREVFLTTNYLAVLRERKSSEIHD
jgi:FkbM family methyltransferase